MNRPKVNKNLSYYMKYQQGKYQKRLGNDYNTQQIKYITPTLIFLKTKRTERSDVMILALIIIRNCKVYFLFFSDILQRKISQDMFQEVMKCNQQNYAPSDLTINLRSDLAIELTTKISLHFSNIAIQISEVISYFQ